MAARAKKPAKAKCAACSKPFVPRNKRHRFCSDTCRQRGKRSGQRPVDAKAETPPTDEPPAEDVHPEGYVGRVERAVRAELEAAGRLGTSLAEQAVSLARHIDTGHAETGSAFAALHRQLQVTMEAALQGESRGDVVDDLAAARKKRLEKAGGGS